MIDWHKIDWENITFENAKWKHDKKYLAYDITSGAVYFVVYDGENTEPCFWDEDYDTTDYPDYFAEINKPQ